ncbi:MAG: PilZ domain-containing protein [Myxococcales bacterium]|nr:PilZ domain-containing protein [Myxococcales bacterium]
MAEDDNHDERRRSPRASVDLQVGLRFDSVQQFLSAYAGDISETGMFVRIPNPRHEVGEIVTLRFDAGKERIVQGTARVARVIESGIGLEFIDLDGPGRKLVEMIVRIKLAAG